MNLPDKNRNCDKLIKSGNGSEYNLHLLNINFQNITSAK